MELTVKGIHLLARLSRGRPLYAECKGADLEVELAAGYGEAEIPRRLRLTLLESAPRILSEFPERSWPHPSCTCWAWTCAPG